MQALKTMPIAALILLIAACSPPAPDANTSSDVAELPDIQQSRVSPSLSPEGQPLEQPISCQKERGDAQAKALVDRCLAVSPATRPPCNVTNPCAMIEDEIKRGCDVFSPADKPAECAA